MCFTVARLYPLWKACSSRLRVRVRITSASASVTVSLSLSQHAHLILGRPSFSACLYSASPAGLAKTTRLSQRVCNQHPKTTRLSQPICTQHPKTTRLTQRVYAASPPGLVQTTRLSQRVCTQHPSLVQPRGPQRQAVFWFFGVGRCSLMFGSAGGVFWRNCSPAKGFFDAVFRSGAVL